MLIKALALAVAAPGVARSITTAVDPRSARRRRRASARRGRDGAGGRGRRRGSARRGRGGAGRLGVGGRCGGATGWDTRADGLAFLPRGALWIQDEIEDAIQELLDEFFFVFIFLFSQLTQDTRALGDALRSLAIHISGVSLDKAICSALGKDG